ncbi:hypothetical protein JHK85_043808 [Glycine max]|nr:hypothetical protein JHK85_043808 [Glycine max]
MEDEKERDFISEFVKLLSDISRLEAKVERLEGQLQVKDKDIATITRTVDAYESKNQELVAENDDLRALLRSMQSTSRAKKVPKQKGQLLYN